MSSPKPKYPHLYSRGKPQNSSENKDKQIVERLRELLASKIAEPGNAKKAAIILENFLKENKGPKK